MNHDDVQPANPLFNLIKDDDSIRSYTQTVPVLYHHFYIVEEISDDVNRYLNLINCLKTSEPKDTVIIYLNTVGGSIYTALQIINSIRASEATVVCSLDSIAASAGSMIFLAANKFIVAPNCTMMIHDYSQGIMTSGHSINVQVDFQKSYFKKLYKDIYSGFLTDSEINSVLTGTDMWLSADQILSRLKKGDTLNILIEEEKPKRKPKVKAKKAKTKR